MPRTTSELVIAHLRPGTQGGDYDDVNNPSLTPYITAARLMVDNWLAAVVRKGYSIPDGQDSPYADAATLPGMLERLLACHFYQSSDQAYASRSTAGASGSFKGSFSGGLCRTTYGQDALRLDWTFALRDLDKQQRIVAFAVGNKPENQGKYRDRALD